MRPANSRKKVEVISWLIIKTQTHNTVTKNNSCQSWVELLNKSIVKSKDKLIDKRILRTNN